MLSVSYEEYHDVIYAAKYLPCVSIIMPFEPKMEQKSAIENRLKSVINKIKNRLQENYPNEKAVPVFHKLNLLIKDLNYSTHKKSIAVFVSPVVEKVYYLDIPVKEKISIDESFEIRDLVYSKKDLHEYLLLVIGKKQSTIFLGNSVQFVRIVSDTPSYTVVVRNDVPVPLTGFPDISSRNDVLLENFLQHIDTGLGIILQSYPLPLFVMGTDRIIRHFKKLTHNSDNILSYIPGDFEELNEIEICKAIAPYVDDWKKVKQQNLLLQLKVARETKKLSTGIADVGKMSSVKKRRLLIMEKNYACPFQHEPAEDIYRNDYDDNSPFYIKDAADKVIEKVLENGGDVEFVDDDVLKDYQHIALIQY